MPSELKTQRITLIRFFKALEKKKKQNFQLEHFLTGSLQKLTLQIEYFQMWKKVTILYKLAVRDITINKSIRKNVANTLLWIIPEQTLDANRSNRIINVILIVHNIFAVCLFVLEYTLCVCSKDDRKLKLLSHIKRWISPSILQPHHSHNSR